MNKWFIIYRILSMNVVLYTINLADSLLSHPQYTLTSLSDNNNTNSLVSRHTNLNPVTKMSEVSDNFSNTLSLDKLLGKSGQDDLTGGSHSTNYDVKEVRNLFYTFKQGVKFTEFKYGDTIVWKLLPGKNKDYPSKMRITKSSDYLSVYVDSDSYRCQYTLVNSSWKLYTMKNVCYDPDGFGVKA